MIRFTTLTAAAMILAAPVTAQDAKAGQDTYLRYCASCHGLDATGRGPMHAVLTVLPANLTTLKSENGGVFPIDRVVRRIDGRDPLVSHGSEMPIYGYFFEGQDQPMKTKSGQPIMTSLPVAELVVYLETLQVE